MRTSASNSDRILVEGVEFHGFHGVPEAERVVGHRFRADVELEMDLAPAALADDLALTVDYGAVARRVVAIGSGPSVRLVETLAEAVARDLLTCYPQLRAVTITLRKLHPPTPTVFASSGVVIRRSRVV
jgi:dihydroneopterin aldolase